MMDSQLFEFARCPITKTPLTPAPQELIEQLQKLAGQDQLKSRIGRAIGQAPEAGLLDEGRQYLYPVSGEIPTLIPDEAIELSGLADMESKQ